MKMENRKIEIWQKEEANSLEAESLCGWGDGRAEVEHGSGIPFDSSSELEEEMQAHGALY